MAAAGATATANGGHEGGGGRALPFSGTLWRGWSLRGGLGVRDGPAVWRWLNNPRREREGERAREARWPAAKESERRRGGGAATALALSLKAPSGTILFPRAAPKPTPTSPIPPIRSIRYVTHPAFHPRI